ncbi:hypothetical protein LJC00_03140 [Dysgonomonas sp. OttesenSCG-928-M03]|nr:hypothetical protein [Dysgonomonas sp. OttesenSCG-928-M03]
MNELEINYGLSKSQKTFSVIAGGYITLYAFYQCLMLALRSAFTLDFYLALAALVLGVIMILNATAWKSKPMFRMNSESIYVSMPELKSVYSAEWISIKEVGIGISYLKFSETDGKSYNVDISGLKYEDLKTVKSKIIEMCESKNIPYKND